MLDFDNLQNYREDGCIEAKEALGGLPESIWETYAAFANADGGVILLGVKERPDKTLQPVEILDPQWIIEDFWNAVNDPMKVSVNLLKEEDVQIRQAEGKQIIAIYVPKAKESQKPVYIGNDPYRGSYYRRGEEDIRFTQEQVREMLAKRGEAQ